VTPDLCLSFWDDADAGVVRAVVGSVGEGVRGVEIGTLSLHAADAVPGAYRAWRAAMLGVFRHAAGAALGRAVGLVPYTPEGATDER
jgi:hypothetical protein